MARQEFESFPPQSPLEAMLTAAADRPTQASFAPLLAYVLGSLASTALS
jgi:hypothetical protein